MLRAALYCVLLAALGAGWLAMPAAPCRITVEEQFALFGFITGALGAAALSLLATINSLARRWDERRSRTWRLP